MKTKFISTVLCFLLSFSLYAQEVIWGQVAGGFWDDEAEALVIDASGNIYVTGFFKSASITLGDITLKNPRPERPDVFLAKYDPSGKVLWARSGGGLGEDQPLGISLDPSGNIIVRGYSEGGNVTFGDKTIKLNPDAYSNMFLVKYDPLGNVKWLKGAEVYSSAHAMDAAGNLYVTGDLFANVETAFDDMKLFLPDKGFFLAKYDPSGKLLWAKKTGGGKALSVSVDKQGNAFVSGTTFFKVLYFDNGVRIKNEGPEKTTDMFVAKFSASGNLQWAKGIGGKGQEEPRSQLVDPFGNFYVVLRFSSINLTLGKNHVHSNGGGDDLMLIKYDNNGNVIWSERAGGSGHDNPVFISCDEKGDIYLSGHYYSNTITFDHLVLENAGKNDIFIVKYAANGKVQWARTTGTSNHDYPLGQLIDKDGNFYLIGIFNSSPNASKVINEFFMEKYDAKGNLVWKNNEHRTDYFDFAFGETLDNLGNMYMVGYFGGEVRFGNTLYKSKGGKDLFVTKFKVK